MSNMKFDLRHLSFGVNCDVSRGITVYTVAYIVQNFYFWCMTISFEYICSKYEYRGIPIVGRNTETALSGVLLHSPSQGEFI